MDNLLLTSEESGNAEFKAFDLWLKTPEAKTYLAGGEMSWINKCATVRREAGLQAQVAKCLSVLAETSDSEVVEKAAAGLYYLNAGTWPSETWCKTDSHKEYRDKALFILSFLTPIYAARQQQAVDAVNLSIRMLVDTTLTEAKKAWELDKQQAVKEAYQKGYQEVAQIVKKYEEASIPAIRAQAVEAERKRIFDAIENCDNGYGQLSQEEWQALKSGKSE